MKQLWRPNGGRTKLQKYLSCSLLTPEYLNTQTFSAAHATRLNTRQARHTTPSGYIRQQHRPEPTCAWPSAWRWPPPAWPRARPPPSLPGSTQSRLSRPPPGPGVFHKTFAQVCFVVRFCSSTPDAVGLFLVVESGCFLDPRGGGLLLERSSRGPVIFCFRVCSLTAIRPAVSMHRLC